MDVVPRGAQWPTSTGQGARCHHPCWGNATKATARDHATALRTPRVPHAHSTATHKSQVSLGSGEDGRTKYAIYRNGVLSSASIKEENSNPCYTTSKPPGPAQWKPPVTTGCHCGPLTDAGSPPWEWWPPGPGGKDGGEDAGASTWCRWTGAGERGLQVGSTTRETGQHRSVRLERPRWGVLCTAPQTF